MWHFCSCERPPLSALGLLNAPCESPCSDTEKTQPLSLVFWRWRPQWFFICQIVDKPRSSSKFRACRIVYNSSNSGKVWAQGKWLLVCSSCSRTEVVLSLPAHDLKCQCGLLGDCVTQDYKIVLINVDLTLWQKAYCWDLKATVMHKHLIKRQFYCRLLCNPRTLRLRHEALWCSLTEFQFCKSMNKFICCCRWLGTKKPAWM